METRDELDTPEFDAWTTRKVAACPSALYRYGSLATEHQHPQMPSAAPMDFAAQELVASPPSTFGARNSRKAIGRRPHFTLRDCWSPGDTAAVPFSDRASRARRPSPSNPRAPG